MRGEDPEQDWLTSSRNHASSDYDRDRRRETWREANSPCPRSGPAARRRREQKRRNRKANTFGKVNWDVYEHQILYDMIWRAKPERMYARASEWNDLARRIEGTTARVQQVVERVMGSWQGQAAVNAAAANTRLMRWADTAGHTAGRIAEGMADYTEAVEQAQRRMPEPGFASAERNFRNGYTVTTTGGPSDAVFLRELLTDGMVSHEQARARKAEAVQVMSDYEDRAKTVHDTMPQFTDAGPTTQAVPERVVRPADPAPVPPPGGDSGRPPPVPPVPPPGPGVVVPGTTDLAGFDSGRSGVPGVPGGSGPGGTGYGGGGLPGGPGSLNAGADTLRGGAAGPGAMGPGALAGRGPGGAPGGGLGGPGAAGVRGGAGAGAFGGMPFGGAANGDEDGEHTNKYDEGLDLFDDLPPAYPPVFGA